MVVPHFSGFRVSTHLNHKRTPPGIFFFNYPSEGARNKVKLIWLQLVSTCATVVIEFFLYTKSRLVEELQHTTDQDVTEQMEQQERGETYQRRVEGQNRERLQR